MHRALILSTLLWTTSAAAVCPEASSPELLAQQLTAAEQAWTALDSTGFHSALGDVVFTLPCLSEPIAPTLAARTHRAFALQAFGDGKERTASAAFRAAHAASPAAGNPKPLLPSGHAALQLYESSLEAVDYSPIQPEPARALLFDGTPRVERPLDIPALTQTINEAGAVQHTRYVAPGQELPPYDIAPRVTTLPSNPPPAAKPRKRRALSATLGTVTTLAALSTAGLSGAAIWSHREFQADHPNWELQHLDARRRHTNTLTIGAAAAGITTAAAGFSWVIAR